MFNKPRRRKPRWTPQLVTFDNSYRSVGERTVSWFVKWATRSKTMKITTFKGASKAKLIFFVLACTLGLAANAATDMEKQQKQIRSMVQDTLQQLYKAEPKSKLAVKHAA